MSREHTFMDSQFHREDYDAEDEGTYIPDLVFVIMSFRDDMTATYAAIKDECAELGLNAQRADEKVGSGIVIAEITTLIEDAEFIICDLTHERPNVYYELGYAHGVGNEGEEILLIAREGTTLHFDIAPLRVHYYASVDDLRAILQANLPEMVRLSRE